MKDDIIGQPNIVVPWGAGPGQSRYVIASELPPPLDTYDFFGLYECLGATIFYGATPSDDDYQFTAYLVAGTNYITWMGYVNNGAVVEYSAGIPAGTLWTLGPTGIVNMAVFATPTGPFQINGEAALSDIDYGADYQSSGTGTTTSATFVDYPGPLNIIFSKLHTAASTRILVQCGFTLYSDAANTGVEYALRINGTDYPIAAMFINAALEHTQVVTVRQNITGLADGLYTARLRWRRTTGAGVLNVNADDVISIRIRETAA